MRRPIVTVLAVGLTVVASCLISSPAVRAQDEDSPERLRFSLVYDAVPRYYEMVGLVGAPAERSAGGTLLPDIEPPEALLLETLGPPGALAQALSLQPEPTRESTKKSKKKPTTFSLSDNWTAQLSYRHAVLATTMSAKELREKLADFSTDRERDVLGLQMDWRVASSSKVGFGYLFQSSRRSPGSGISGIGESFMHAFTLGFTKEWGGAPPPD